MMNDEEDMLELLDDEGTADQLDLELDEPEEEASPYVDESIEEAAPEPEESEEPEETGGRELEIDIRLIIVAIVAIAAIILAGVFFVMPILMPAGPPTVTMTPSQSGEDVFLYYESGPDLQEQDVRFTLGGVEIPREKIMLMGGVTWPWTQGTVLKVDTSGYAKPATVAVLYTKGEGETLLFSAPAEPTPTPTPTPTPEPTPEPVMTPEILVPSQPIPVQPVQMEDFMNQTLIRFDAQPTTGIQPLTVQFADQTQVCAQNRSWNFGDGMTSNARYPEHIYPFPGTYTASLDMTFCDPDESSETPVKEITVLPVDRQDTLLSGPGAASIDAGGSLFFTVRGPAMLIRIGGKDSYLKKGDLVRIDLNDGGTGYISIINNAIVQFNFENVSIWVNDKEFGSGWLTNININQYEQIASADITIRIIAQEPGLKGLVNGIPAIVASPGQMVTLHNVGTDSTGKFLFSIQDGAGFSFRGGIESYEVTTPF